jgi:hypothetical protein
MCAAHASARRAEIPWRARLRMAQKPATRHCATGLSPALRCCWSALHAGILFGQHRRCSVYPNHLTVERGPGGIHKILRCFNQPA